MRICQNNHTVEGKGQCKECRKEQKRRYYERNPEKKRQQYKTAKQNKPLYAIWNGMMARCYNEKHEAYANYGGRGITVCERWKNYDNFVADMGARPSPQHTIDRINNDMGYELSNCRWATRKEQNRNRSDNTLITYKGETLTVTEWAERLGIASNTMFNRLSRWKDLEKVMNYTPTAKTCRAGLHSYDATQNEGCPECEAAWKRGYRERKKAATAATEVSGL